ncbi:MAG: glycosyltransferase [Balneolaceae bacterium]|nr:MAG: glycosyltransferase [Balneolaceae bacterium]
MLLIFVKNAINGHVKTRLAADLGDKRALGIYRKMLLQTLSEAAEADASKEVWYSSFIEKKGNVNEKLFHKKLQQGENLGERMKFAFNNAFKNGYKKVVIIGSDCPEITSDLLNDAFRLLESKDVVIGPSEDGGYYLLGKSLFEPSLFDRVEWSSPKVLQQTLEKIKKKSLSVALLHPLNDIDTIEDLKKSKFFNEG